MIYFVSLSIYIFGLYFYLFCRKITEIIVGCFGIISHRNARKKSICYIYKCPKYLRFEIMLRLKKSFYSYINYFKEKQKFGIQLSPTGYFSILPTACT